MPRRKPEETAGPAAMLARRGEFTVGQAAKEIGRSPDTIRRWIRQGRIEPRQVQCGSMTVSVFTFKEITEMKKLSKSIKIGRPPVGLKPMTTQKKKVKK